MCQLVVHAGIHQQIHAGTWGCPLAKERHADFGPALMAEHPDQNLGSLPSIIFT